MSEMVNSPGPPFREGLAEGLDYVGQGAYVDVRQYNDNPKVVVKELREGNEFSYRSELHPQSLENVREIQQYIAMLQDPSNPAHEFIPKSWFVLGQNKHGEDRYFMVQEKVEGQTLEQLAEGEQTDRLTKILLDGEKEQLKQIILGIIDTYIATYNTKTGLGLMIGLNKENLVRGHLHGEENTGDKTWCIDFIPVNRWSIRGVKEKLNQWLMQYLDKGLEDMPDLIAKLDVLTT